MILYSVTFKRGRGQSEHRNWFDSAKAAKEAVEEMEKDKRSARDINGPHKHVIEGKAGLVNCLNEYAGLGA